MELSDFEKEYYDEINNSSVKLETLEKYGVDKKTLAKEVFLHNIYGDKILVEDDEETEIKGAKKSITRLGEAELGIKSELEQIYEGFELASFDEKLSALGIKFDDE